MRERIPTLIMHGFSTHENRIVIGALQCRLETLLQGRDLYDPAVSNEARVLQRVLTRMTGANIDVIRRTDDQGNLK